MINNLFEKVKDTSLKEYASNSNYEEYAGIVLNPDDNTFKILSGLFRDKKEMYDKMRKRGLVCRKVFEKKIFYWVLDNAKSVLDAYLMLSTAFSKWRNNNILSDYYIKLLNDLPKINREKRKGDPQSIGSNKGWYKEAVLSEADDEDLFKDEIEVEIQPIVAVTNEKYWNTENPNFFKAGDPIKYTIKTSYLNYRAPNHPSGRNPRRYDDKDFYTYIYNKLNHWNFINDIKNEQDKNLIINLINKEYENKQNNNIDDILYLKPGVLITELDSNSEKVKNSRLPGDNENSLAKSIYPEIQNNQKIILYDNIFQIMETKVWNNDYDWVWNEINSNHSAKPLYRPDQYARLIEIKAELSYYNSLKNKSTNKDINNKYRDIINNEIGKLKEEKKEIEATANNRISSDTEVLYKQTIRKLIEKRNEIQSELDPILERQKTNTTGIPSKENSEKIEKLEYKINFFNNTLTRLRQNKKEIKANFSNINKDNITRLNNGYINNILGIINRKTSGTDEQLTKRLDIINNIKPKLQNFYDQIKNGNIDKTVISKKTVKDIEKVLGISEDKSIIYNNEIIQNTEEDKTKRDNRIKELKDLNNKKVKIADKTVKDWEDLQTYKPNTELKPYEKIVNNILNTLEDVKDKNYLRYLVDIVLKEKAKELSKEYNSWNDKFRSDYKNLFKRTKGLERIGYKSSYTDDDFMTMAKEYFTTSLPIEIGIPYTDNQVETFELTDRLEEFEKNLMNKFNKNRNKKTESTQVNDGATLLYNTQPKTNNIHGEITEEVTNDQLNQKLFDDKVLKEEVRVALLKIALLFENLIDIPVKCEDVYFTGSCANYNYNEYSDIDLHLVYDFSKLDYYKDILDNYFNSLKKVFNNKYHITIKDYPVEVGIEDINKPLVSSGVYSLINNKWVKEPNNANIEIQEPDKGFYNLLTSDIEEAIQSKDSEVIGNLWKKLGNLRKVSLASLGEFGPGNTLFKRLRNEKYLERLKDAYYNSKSNELSVESLEENI